MPPRLRTNETVPPELLRAGSHDVRLSAGGKALAVAAGVLFAGGWILGLWLSLKAARIWAISNQEVPLWVGPVVIVCFSAAAAGMVMAVRREARLLENGRVAVGRVVDSRKIHKSSGHGSHTEYRLTIEFRTMSGALRRARFDRRKEVPLGGQVVVVYDRDDPGRSQLYPFRLVRSAFSGKALHSHA